MIEWQNESSLFVIRIQGKQWYWVYKYNSDTNYRLNNVYINVGNDNWYNTSNQGTVNFNINNSTLIYIYEYEFKKAHKAILEKNSKLKKDLILSNFNTQFFEYKYNISKANKINIPDFVNKFVYYTNISNSVNLNYFDWVNINSNLISKLRISLKVNYNYDFLSSIVKNKNVNLLNLSENSNITNYEADQTEDLEETSENLRTQVNNFPVKLLKGVLNKHNVSLLNSSETLNKNIFLSYRLNNSQVTEKIDQVEQFWGFRQKKYKKLRSFVFSQNYKFNSKSYKSIGNFVNNENFSKYNLYTGVKNNKTKNELIPVTLARRLLRTKRTLVLPAHINITIITSSYDVVHSWFVPGLGLKIDCVPGRSNHLTLYIDNIGFYYGQCAEICGRYHHHMPIRVCALDYNHFLLWWQTKGLPRMYRSKELINKKSILLSKFKA
jgi:heme/copper-type cytochrome/quinol oxidase subunit 2